MRTTLDLDDDVPIAAEAHAPREKRSLLHGHHQITDARLPALAVKHGGVLASFGVVVPLPAVRGARKSRRVTL
jgi:hypothetical protein